MCGLTVSSTNCYTYQDLCFLRVIFSSSKCLIINALLFVTTQQGVFGNRGKLKTAYS